MIQYSMKNAVIGIEPMTTGYEPVDLTTASYSK